MFKSWINLLMIAASVAIERSLFDLHDYDMFGNRMTIFGDSLVVIIRNDLRQFFIGYDMFAMLPSTSAHYCHVDYMNTDDYVQSVVGSPINSSFFVYIGENYNRTFHFIGIINIANNCTSTQINRQYFISQPSLEGYDIYTIGIEPRGLFVYIIGWDVSWIYDLTTFQLKKLDSIQDIWQQIFKPYDLIILDNNQYAVIVGYSFLANWHYYMAISLLRLDPPNNITLVSNQIIRSDIEPIEEDLLSYSPMNSLAIAINNENQILIGIPMYNLVLQGSVSTTVNISVQLSNISMTWNAGPKNLSGMFGKSIVWLDNNTFAVLAYSIATLPWSSSQILVFSMIKNLSSSTQPTFTYPNNQQTLNSSLRSPKFIQLQSTSFGHLAVLLDTGHVQLVCVAPPGIYVTSTKLVSNSSMMPFYGCQPIACLAGTFKRSSSIGPCSVCPSGQKNPKNSNATDIECEPCSSNSYCPLAAVDDVSRDPYTIRVSQDVTYPEGSESDAYDDILVQNMLRLQTNSFRCVIVSPLLWTLITVGIVLCIIVLAGLLRMFPKCTHHYLFITRIFKKTDLIGEGELWVGGLISFSVLVIVIFAYAFSGTFIHLYPIETSSTSPLTCDSSIRNAKFSTGFRLLSLPITEDEIPIFNLLNEQPLTLSIDLLNTLVKCLDITITFKSGSNEIPFYNYICNQTNLAIVSITFPLPTHLITVDFNFSTSSSIGGLRACLSGPEHIESSSYVVRSLHICEFFGQTNETLGRKPHINLVLTKVINKTEPLVVGDRILFSGIFVPTVTTEGISDEFLYNIQGEYKRYLFTYTFLAIDLSETQFYILNRQDPIVREGEMIFHNILFTIAVIEMFGFTFLIFKLIIIPLIRWLTARFCNKTRIESVLNEIKNDETAQPFEQTHPQHISNRRRAILEIE